MSSRSAFVLVAVLAAPGAAWTQPYAFVSGAAAESIGVIDLGTDTLVSSFALGGLPSGAAVTRDGTRLLVARSRQDSVVLIDTATGGVTSIAVGAAPGGVAFGGRPLRAYVANTGDDTVSVIDPVAGTVVATIPVGAAPVDLVTGGTRVYVANWAGGTISVVDWTSNTVVGSVAVGSHPAGLALHEPTGRVYVANFFDDTVSVIDTTTLSVVATVPVVRRPRGLALDPVTRRLYVAGFEDGRIAVVDTQSNAVVLQGASGRENPMDLLLGEGGQHLYVAHLGTGQSIRVLDASTLAPLGAIDAPAGPVALAGPGRHAPPVAPTASWPAPAPVRLPALPRASRARQRATASAPGRGPTDVTFSDGVFLPSSWEVFLAVGNQNSTQQTVGGNPGAWRRTFHFPSGSQVETTHEYVDEFYDPSTSGPVAWIDAFWDRRTVPAGVAERAPGSADESFVVFQGGVAYRTDPETFTSLAWESASRVGLTAADFDDGSGGQPNFTTTGGLITVGYYRRTPPGPLVGHGIDNFLVTVHPGLGGPPGIFRFTATTGVVVENETFTVTVERIGGTQGAVDVTVLVQNPLGFEQSETLTWPDGDGDPRTVDGSFQLPEPGAGIRTARFTLVNPTGGASIHPSLDTMVIAVVPTDWPLELKPLLQVFLLLLAGFSPFWLLALAVPAAVVAARRWRGLGRSDHVT